MSMPAATVLDNGFGDVGRKDSIPYEDAFFDHVLACHACYYVDPGPSFADNIAEIARQ